MEFLKKYTSHEEYEVDKTPNVSLCVENNEKHLHYTKKKFDNEYLTFEALESGTFSFSLNSIQYSLDGGETWATLTTGNSTPTVAAGETIMWKQTGLTPTTASGIGTFSSSCMFNARGNIMSLYYGDDFKDKVDLTGKPYAFRRLFQNNGNIIDASNLCLPATTLVERCYDGMFWECSNLKILPELPATTLANYCYWGTFRGTAVEESPILSAETLVEGCYNHLFMECPNLKKVTCLATDISANECLTDWITEVGEDGTFVKAPSMTSWPSGASGIPNGWNVEDYAVSPI